MDLVLSSCGSLTTLNSETAGSRTSLGSTIGANGGRCADERKQGGRWRRKCVVGPVENMHFEGHLLHRVCGVAGKLPTGSSSDRESDDGGDQARSGCSLLEDSGEDQLVRLRRNPVIMDILVRLKALSLSLVDPSGRGAEPSSPGKGRGGGGSVARVARQGYLRLFEEMLAEILKNQRGKSKVRVVVVVGGERVLLRVTACACMKKCLVRKTLCLNVLAGRPHIVPDDGKHVRCT